MKTARLPMSPGPITVRRRLLYTRSCCLSLSFCLFKAGGDVYLRLCVCFCRSVTQRCPQVQGSRVFELFLNHYDHPSSAEKEAFLQGEDRIRWGHFVCTDCSHQSLSLSFSSSFFFFLGDASFLLTWTNILPHSLRYRQRLKATRVGVCISALQQIGFVFSIRACRLREDLPEHYVRLQLPFKSHFAEVLWYDYCY